MSSLPTSFEYLGTAIFALAIFHTFFASQITSLSAHYPKSSIQHQTLHLLGEVEIVFGFWAGIYIGCIALFLSTQDAILFVEKQNFTEPAFVFVIMAVAATRSIRELAAQGIDLLSKALNKITPFWSSHETFYAVTLILGPILGSLITEPAAMTVTALILRDRYFNSEASLRFKYKTIGLLFVNISIGGVLTHFAAPPVVMVASRWGWNTPFMFSHFGWKAVTAVLINVIFTMTLLRSEFKKTKFPPLLTNKSSRTPIGVTLTHILFLIAIVLTAHHISVFIGLFLLFMGVMQITEPHQEPLQMRESFLVAYFLAGLVVLGSVQGWWLSPLLKSLSDLPLFIGAALLTAITDNAALTYLGSQVDGLAFSLKYALVAGAVTGGGLTIIANAPNPAGYGILKDTFGENGLNALRLLLAAAIPTLIAALCFWLLP
jgi:hypothetical protein